MIHVFEVTILLNMYNTKMTNPFCDNVTVKGVAIKIPSFCQYSKYEISKF